MSGNHPKKHIWVQKKKEKKTSSGIKDMGKWERAQTKMGMEMGDAYWKTIGSISENAAHFPCERRARQEDPGACRESAEMHVCRVSLNLWDDAKAPQLCHL